jgi:peptidyl-dipeptidase Dcp
LLSKIHFKKMSSFDASNPLLSTWTDNHGLPPFSLIKPAHFEPAFEIAMKQNIEELKVIANNVEAATFENTIAAFDRSGSLHTKIYNCFDNLCGSNGVPELQEVELKMAGPLAAHNSQVYTLPGLFAKIDAVHETRQSLNLSSEQLRLVERFHLDFVRAGAKFDTAAQARYAAITEEQANLETKFTQNILADESEITIQLTKEDLSGLPEDLIASARQAAVDRKIEAEDAYVITLSRSLVEPFITYSTRRDLREKAWRLWTSRGELDAVSRLNSCVCCIHVFIADSRQLVCGSSSVGSATGAGPHARLSELRRVRHGRHHGGQSREGSGAVGGGY